ncbi:MAG: hypothetical protein U0931_13690 [Vulcanimicrobiota bacterium]
MSSQNPDRLHPYARVWTSTLSWIYSHLIYSNLVDRDLDDERPVSLRYGASTNNAETTLFYLDHTENARSSDYAAYGFVWPPKKRPSNKEVKKLSVCLTRLLAFLSINAHQKRSLLVTLTENQILRVSGLRSIKGLSALLAMTKASIRYSSIPPHVKPPIEVKKKGEAWAFTLQSSCAGKVGNDGYFLPVSGVSEWMAMGLAEDGRLVPMSPDQKVKTGMADPTKEQVQRGVKEILDWQSYAISGPRLIHSADLGLRAEEEALYCWLERNLTSAGPGKEAYRLFQLDGYEGKWLGALSNHGAQKKSGPKGNRLWSIVKNSYFPINKETWRPKEWYRVLRSLMVKLDGVLLIKFPDGTVKDAADWESPPGLEDLSFFPYLPLEWYRKINVVYAAFNDGVKSSVQVEYLEVMMDAREALKLKRLALGLEPADIATRFGVSVHTVKSWESRKRSLSRPEVLRWIQTGEEWVQNSA